MKKALPILLVAFVAFLIGLPAVVTWFASGDEAPKHSSVSQVALAKDEATTEDTTEAEEEPATENEEGEEVTDEKAFQAFTGVIDEVTETEGVLSIAIKTEDNEDEVTILKVAQDTLQFDSAGEAVLAKDLQAGDKVTGLVASNKPAALIFPPQYNVDALIKVTEGEVALANFNEELVNEDNSLKLNLADDVVIVDTEGAEKTAEDAKNQTLLVFYDVTTRSIPAQATPKKVIITAFK